MAWVNIGIAVGGAILGKKESDKAGKRADQDRAAAQTVEERQLGLAENQDARAGELYQHYKDVFMPRETQLVGEAFDRPLSPARAEARSLADVRGALTTARASGDRNLRRLGVDPSSGNALALREQGGLEEARIEAGARTAAREGVRDQNFSRQATVLGMAQPGAASGYAANAQAGVAGVSSLAAARARNSDLVAQDAATTYGSTLGSLADAGAAAWKARQRKSSGIEVEPGLFDDQPYKYA